MPQSVLKVLYRLKSKGHLGLLVGGALRDLYRGKVPRDFDVATDANIERIRSLFRNSKIIGKRFPIVHAYFGAEVVEISSLKGEPGMSREDLILEDALRRDFTVNAVFYNIDGFQVIDPIGGLEHIQDGKVVCIGDAAERFEEDAIRMLRALKLVAKQGFTMDDPLIEVIRKHSNGVTDIGAGRRYEELTRVFMDDACVTILEQCTKLHLFGPLWPQGAKILEARGYEYFDQLRKVLPVSYSRGSFAKHTHTHLWMRLYLESPGFEPSPKADHHMANFEAFIEPLAMPFRGPIVEAAQVISRMLLAKPDQRLRFTFNKEVQRLVQYYLENMADEDLQDRFLFNVAPPTKRKPADIKPKNRRRRRRRKRRRGGPGGHS